MTQKDFNDSAVAVLRKHYPEIKETINAESVDPNVKLSSLMGNYPPALLIGYALEFRNIAGQIEKAKQEEKKDQRTINEKIAEVHEAIRKRDRYKAAIVKRKKRGKNKSYTDLLHELTTKWGQDLDNLESQFPSLQEKKDDRELALLEEEESLQEQLQRFAGLLHRTSGDITISY